MSPVLTDTFELPRQRLSGRVVHLDKVAQDVFVLQLDVGGEAPFRFRAGQYARLSFGDLPPRDYSIGSRPDDPLLEFYIRDTGDGGSSTYVSRSLRIGDPVGIEGPFGSSFLGDAETWPILAIAGGSGLAPMKSIIETALHRGHDQAIHFYFGVRRYSDIYLEAHFRSLAQRHPALAFNVVLSEEPASDGYRQGLVTDAIAEDFADLSGFSIYLAGPPPMVASAMALLDQRGASKDRIHADPFDRGATTDLRGSRTGSR